MLYNPSSSRAQPPWCLQNNQSLEVLIHSSFMGALLWSCNGTHQTGLTSMSLAATSLGHQAPFRSHVASGKAPSAQPLPACPPRCGGSAQASPAHPGRHSPQTASAVAVQLDFCRRLMRAQDRQGLQPWCPQRSLNFLGGQATHCASPPLPSPQSCKAQGWGHGCGMGPRGTKGKCPLFGGRGWQGYC